MGTAINGFLLDSNNGVSSYSLNSENDLKMLLTGANLYKVNFVDVNVSRNGGSTSKRSATDDDETSCVIDENDYLTEAYRNEPSKTYLSKEWETYIHSKGQKFRGGVDEFREMHTKYSIQVGFEFVYLRNYWYMIVAVCSNVGTDHCHWHVAVYSNSPDGCFFVDDMNNSHTCQSVLRKETHPLLGSKIVKTCILEDMTSNMAMKSRDIINKLKIAYGLSISYKVAWLAKQKAKEMIYGSKAESFNKLSWYKVAVLESNPGSTFVLDVDLETNQFQRLFVAYAGCVKGFQYCLPLLYVDGTFGKSLYKGQILAAIGRTTNKGFFPLAMCVCDSETEGNWLYFFQHLKSLLEPQGIEITYISDRGAGLLSAFSKVFPGNPHIFCYKQFGQNLMGKFPCTTSEHKTLVRDKFFRLAYSCSDNKYRFHLRELKEVGGDSTITDFLKDLPLECWCRAFFRGSRFGVMANSIVESFNSWISVEREMPVYAMLDQTRIKIMELMARRRDGGLQWTSQLTPAMEQILKEKMDVALKYHVHYSHTNVYEVRSKYSYVVDLGSCSCSCRKWEVECFPCAHSLAAMHASKANIFDFMDKHFHLDHYLKCYEFRVNPVGNADMVAMESLNESLILPPNVKRAPGRPKNKRIKSAGEIEKKLIRCSRCLKMGHHNRSSCNEPMTAACAE